MSYPTEMLTGQAVPFYLGVPMMIALLILLSQLLGSIVVRTHAILLPVLFHYIGKVGDGMSVLIILGLVLAVYFFWSKLQIKDKTLIADADEAA